jgi:ATP-dependent DNA ligase
MKQARRHGEVTAGSFARPSENASIATDNARFYGRRGMMSKRASTPYSGGRTESWLKI